MEGQVHTIETEALQVENGTMICINQDLKEVPLCPAGEMNNYVFNLQEHNAHFYSNFKKASLCIKKNWKPVPKLKQKITLCHVVLFLYYIAVVDISEHYYYNHHY